MKKRHLFIVCASVFAVFAVVLAVVLFGRGDKIGDEDRDDPYSEVLEYPVENIQAYCVGEDGTLYVSQWGETAVRAYNEKGECLAVYPPAKVAKLANSESNIGFYSLCYADGKVYCAANESSSLQCIDLASGEMEVIEEDGIFNSVFEMAVEGDVAAVICDLMVHDCDRSIASGRIENYQCSGEQLRLFNLATKSWEEPEYHNIVTVAAMEGQGFLVEGFDAENGFYLAEMSLDGTLGDKLPTGFTGKVYLDWDEENELFHGAVSVYGSAQKCISGPLDAPKETYQYWSNSLSIRNGNVRYKDGCLYLLSSYNGLGDGGVVTRLKPELFFRDNEPMKAYILRGAKEPDWQGYQVETEVIEYQELALKLLAGDDDFDFVILDTTMPEAWDMKRVGAYAPLNSALEDALSECLAGVQELALDDGAVWCLPVAMTVQGLVYSEANLKKHGASLADATTVKELAEVAELLHRAERDDWFEVNLNLIGQYLVKNYVGVRLEDGKISFDTEEFRAILDWEDSLEEREIRFSHLGYPTAPYQDVYDQVMAEYDYSFDAIGIASLARQDAYHRDILFELILDGGSAVEYDKYVGMDGFSIAPVPGIDGGEQRFTANANILIVNQKSRHRNQAVNMVKKIAEAVFHNPESWLSADRGLYPQDAFSDALYAANASAHVMQELPWSVIQESYRKLFDDSYDRSEAIKELERIVNTYYFE